MKNWFGQDCHPSDELLHWQDNAIADSPQLRSDYDLIANLGPRYREALKNLLDRARRTGASDEADANNPDL